jgi:DNA-directed RNA polymerase specialized sigma subunit
MERSMPRGNLTSRTIKGVNETLVARAMQMAIAQSQSPDPKRNWVVFRMRRDGFTFKKIAEFVPLSNERLRQMEHKCCKELKTQLNKLTTLELETKRSQKHGRL